jgi:hypothetical protein
MRVAVNSLLLILVILLGACESPKEIIKVYTFEDFTKVNSVSHTFKYGSALYIKIEGEIDGSVCISNACFSDALVSTNDHYTGSSCYMYSTYHENTINKVLQQEIYGEVQLTVNIYPNTAQKGKVTVTLIDAPWGRMREVRNKMGFWEDDIPQTTDTTQQN